MAKIRFGNKIKPLLLLASVEMLERFAYYGSVSLLVVFLTSDLGFSDSNAYATAALFGALSFALTIVGGILADFFAGIRYLMMLGGTLMLIGCILMATAEASWGLSLIALGAGLFKGNITVLLGSCYSTNEPRRGLIFTIFYAGINVGALTASLLCAYIYQDWGYSFSFLLAGLGMFLSLTLFALGTPILEKRGINPTSTLKIPHSKLLTLLIAAFTCLLCKLVLDKGYSAVEILTSLGVIAVSIYLVVILRSSKEEQNNLIIFGFLLAFCLIFYAFQSQIYFVINLFAQRSVNNTIFGHKIPSIAFQAIPPASAILFGLLRSALSTKQNLKTGIVELGIGLCGPTLCFALLYLGCVQAEAGKVDCIYLLSIGLIGASEMLVGPFMYNQATLLTPKSLKGYSMSLVLLAIAFGNLATAFIAQPFSANQQNDIELYAGGFGKLALLQAISVIAFFAMTFLLKARINRANSHLSSASIN